MGDSSLFFMENDTMEATYTVIDGEDKVEFVGFAVAGSATSDAKWRIKKLTYNSNGSVLTAKWAFGTSDIGGPYEKVLVFDDKATYTYK